MTAKDKNLNDLFLDTLKDIYYAERAILKALPKMKRGAESSALQKAFDTHRAETETHVERLQQVFELIGKRAQGKTCEAIDFVNTIGPERAFPIHEGQINERGMSSINGWMQEQTDAGYRYLAPRESA